MFPTINIYTNHCGCGSGKTIVQCGCPKAKQYCDPVQTLPAPSVPCDNGSEVCPTSLPWACVLINEDMPDQGISKGDSISKLLNWILQAMANVGLNPSTLPPLAAPVISAFTSTVSKRLDVTIVGVPNATSYEIVVRKNSDQSAVGRFPAVVGVNQIAVLTGSIDYDVQAVAKATGYSDSETDDWSTETAAA